MFPLFKYLENVYSETTVCSTESWEMYIRALLLAKAQLTSRRSCLKVVSTKAQDFSTWGAINSRQFWKRFPWISFQKASISVKHRKSRFQQWLLSSDCTFLALPYRLLSPMSVAYSRQLVTWIPLNLGWGIQRSFKDQLLIWPEYEADESYVSRRAALEAVHTELVFVPARTSLVPGPI